MKVRHLGLLVAALAGCGGSGPAGAGPSNPAGCNVEVLPVEEPSFPYEGLGEIQLACASDTSREACLGRLKQNACKLGGDLIFAVKDAGAGQMIISAQVGRKGANAAPAPTPKAAPTAEAPRAPSSPAPTKAFGFDFGLSEADAVKVCKGAGFEWHKKEAGVFDCTGIPGEGSKGSTAVRFCKEKLCSVDASIVTPRRTGEEWTRRFNLLKVDLQDRFGSPTSSVNKIPGECMDEEIADCVAEGRARVNARWQWPSGEEITLDFHAPSGKASASLRVRYAKEMKK